jgi:ribonucleoside-diphosphate reductase alpha chain
VWLEQQRNTRAQTAAPQTMLDRYQPSPFLDTSAVDAWDAWFRWRDRGELRDVSVDATWKRVAHALAAAETSSTPAWGERFEEAQAQWRLLFDERILAHAGTTFTQWPANPAAVLNAASFVVDPCTRQARIDHAALHATAELAVRGLDNAALLRGAPALDLRIGLVGVADALALLGKCYDGVDGRDVAARLARTLADGCLAGTIRLAAERGATACDNELGTIVKARGTPMELINDAIRHGCRHRYLTAITPQPKLARFANNVSDALDPISANGEPTPWQCNHAARTSGYAATVARIHVANGSANAASSKPCAISPVAQIDLRGAVQPWIDAPIDYPLRLAQAPDKLTQAQWQERAMAYHLGALRWQA